MNRYEHALGKEPSGNYCFTVDKEDHYVIDTFQFHACFHYDPFSLEKDTLVKAKQDVARQIADELVTKYIKFNITHDLIKDMSTLTGNLQVVREGLPTQDEETLQDEMGPPYSSVNLMTGHSSTSLQ